MALPRGQQEPAACCSGEAEAIAKIAELTTQGVMPRIDSITIGADLGGGLPKVIPILIRPGEHGGQVEGLRTLIETYRTGPERRIGTATVTTLQSFIDLVNRHKDDGSAIFARTEWPKPALTAVIDYHDEKNGPRHGAHRILYTFPVTPEFQAWIDGAGKPMTQVDFARFLEDHAAELSAPFDGEKSSLERLFKATFATPNELIDLARCLEVAVGQTFKQAIKLSSGESELVFKEEHTNAAGDKITVPGIFMIALRAFVDGDNVRIPARLRYRASGGGVTWFYDLYRWQDELRDRVSQDLDKAREKTGLPTFEGSPENR